MKIFNIYLFLAAVLVVLAGCNVDVVDAPNSVIQQSLKTKATCKIELTGIVNDVNTLQPITEAVVQLGSNKVRTGNNGRFSIPLSDLLDIDSIGLVSVSKDGYLLSTFEIRLNDVVSLTQCNGDQYVVFQDFPLTPIQPTFKITPLGGKFQFAPEIGYLDNKGALKKTNYPFQVDVPAGTVDKDTEISISPLSAQTLLGKSNDSIQVGRFCLLPSTLQLKKAISITFTPNLPLSAKNKLYVYTFDGNNNRFSNTLVSNKLKLVPDKVSYNDVTNQITLNATQMACFFIGIDSKATLKSVQVNTVIIQNGSVDNCNCGSLTVKELKYSLNTLYNGSSELNPAQRNEIFRVLNIPTNTSIYDYLSPLTVEKCSSRAYEVIVVQEVISSDLGGLPWRATIYRGATIKIATTGQKCPVTSPCHQGCPQ